MAPEAILNIIKTAFPDEVIDLAAEGQQPNVALKPQRWHEVALFLRDDERLLFDWLRCISGVDHKEDGRFTLVYDLHSTLPADKPGGIWKVRNEIAIKVHVDRDDPHVPTVSGVWPAANWHEREILDLLGVTFDGHPDPRRILCPEDWVGHPLRRDYEFPLEYHGIPAVTEHGQSRPQH